MFPRPLGPEELPRPQAKPSALQDLLCVQGPLGLGAHAAWEAEFLKQWEKAGWLREAPVGFREQERPGAHWPTWPCGVS